MFGKNLTWKNTKNKISNELYRKKRKPGNTGNQQKAF